MEKLPDLLTSGEHSNATRLTPSTVEHLRDTGHKLEESKETVIAREQNNLGRRIREALKILCHFKSLNRDRGIEPPVLHGDVLARDMVQPSSRDKTTTAIFTLADLDLLQIDLV